MRGDKEGFYFLTVCTNNKEPNIQRYKEIVEKNLQALPQRITGLNIDYFVLMPTHLHTILVLKKAGKNIKEIVRDFKASVTREAGKKDFWQKDNYEHEIRDEDTLSKIKGYVRYNPSVDKIRFDQFYPAGLLRSGKKT